MTLLNAKLKVRDWERLNVLVESDWDWNLAAEILRTTREKLRRQWRQTMRKNVIEALSSLGISEESLEKHDD